MTEEFIERFNNFKNATENLSAVLRKDYSDLERDGLIKRFELTFETCWKSIKVYITEQGIQKIKSPREAFKAMNKI